MGFGVEAGRATANRCRGGVAAPMLAARLARPGGGRALLGRCFSLPARTVVAAALTPGRECGPSGRPAAQQGVGWNRRLPPTRRRSRRRPGPMHEGVCRVAAADRGDPVAARFLAGDPAVAVVVPTPKGISVKAGGEPVTAGDELGMEALVWTCRLTKTICYGVAAGEHPVQGGRFPAVYGEPVLAPDLQDPAGEPALVLRRQPLGGVMSAFSLFVRTGLPPAPRE